MFDLGFQELTLIGVIALIVVGPERLPRMARTLGLWMGKIRYYVGQVKSDIEREVRAQELKEMLDKPARELDDLYKVAEETKGTLDQAKGALGEAKAAFDSAPASVSTANEPAAGSIFPTELPGPDAGPEQAGSGPGGPTGDDPAHGGSGPSDTGAGGSGQNGAEPSDTTQSGSGPSGPGVGGLARIGSGQSGSVREGPAEPSRESPPEPHPTAMAPTTTEAGELDRPDAAEARPDQHETPVAATGAGENDERSSERA